MKELVALYKKYSALLLAFFKPLGYWGIGVLAVVDSSSIPMPMDAFIAYYAWTDSHRFYLYVFTAALGSAIGGLVPYFAWRLSVSPMIDKRLPQLSREQVFAGLRHFWYDNALSPGEQTFGSLDHVAAPERVVFGTDFPFANPRVIAEMIKTHESGFLSDARRAEIDRANALALFPKYG